MSLDLSWLLRSPLVRQTWTVSSILLCLIGQGMLLGHTSCLVPALMDPKSSIKADMSTISWMVSCIGVSIMPGLIVTSLLMDLCGRKIAFLVTSIPGIIGWITIYFAKTINIIIIGRLLGGLSCGSTIAIGAIIIAEFTSPKYRGTFLTLKTTSLCLGSTIVHSLGGLYHWRTVVIFALIPNVLSFLIILTWPESPAWLASKKQFVKCEEAFYWLSGKDENSKYEIEELIKAQKKRLDESKKKTNIFDSIIDILKKFTRKDFLKPSFILFLSGILLESTGRYVFSAYASQIMTQVTGIETKSFYYILSVDLIITGSTTFSSILIRIFKRRTLLFSTGLAALFVLITCCTYLYLVSIGIFSKERPWISISLLITYFILANLGCTPIPVVWNGELYPLIHRGVGSMVAGFLLNSGIIIFLKYTPYLLQAIEVYGTFGVFAFFMAATLSILYFIVPETKDRTLQEIEDYFNCGHFKDRVTHSSNNEEMKPMVNEENCNNV